MIEYYPIIKIGKVWQTSHLTFDTDVVSLNTQFNKVRKGQPYFFPTKQDEVGFTSTLEVTNY